MMSSSINLENIQLLCRQGKIQWTAHVLQRLLKRNISRNAVKEAILNGRIIEEYPDDYPFPSCLILGITMQQEVFHVVCGIGQGKLWIITAYRPDPSSWDSSFSKRKK